MSEPEAGGGDPFKEIARRKVREALFGIEPRPAEIRFAGRYRIVGSLGEGGMGTVLVAHDETLDREVALKLLHRSMTSDRAQRLRREAQALARISHPHVVQVFEVGQHEGQLFIAMERIAGQTLQQWNAVRHTWQEQVRVYLQAGRGLAAAHTAGLVHRDFKPANCIIDEQGRVFVVDFGLARGVGGSASSDPQSVVESPPNVDALEQSLTRPGAAVGTAAYMAPEQWEGREVGPWSDQFSFCVALFEALYGGRPFSGATPEALALAVREAEPPPPPPGSAVPKAIDAALRRGLHRDHAQRWPSMDALLAVLERALEGRRARGWRYVVLGVVGVAAAAGLGWRLGGRTERCDGAQERLRGVWDGERRQAVEAALVAEGEVVAGEAWSRVEAHLDRYAARWVASHVAACEATSIRGEQPADVLDLRMRCLEGRRVALREAVDVLLEADAAVARRAVHLVTGLPPLATCDDVEGLTSERPPPEDPALAAAVQQQREGIAEVDALRHAGRFDASLERANALVEAVDALDHPPLRAEVRLARGLALRELGRPDDAREDLEEAYLVARAVGHDEVAARAAIELTYVVGRMLARLDEGLGWGRLAEGLTVSTHDARLRARALQMVGLVQFEHGELARARAQLEQALELLESSPEPAPLELMVVEANREAVLRQQGEHELARTIVERVLAMTEEVLGPTHPQVGKLLVNRALAAHDRGDYEQARQDYERGLVVLEQSLGSMHPVIATASNNLGNTLVRLGEHQAALEQHQRSLRIREQVLGADHPHVGESLTGMTGALATLRRWEEARSAGLRALAILEASYGPEHFSLASVLTLLGQVSRELDRGQEAEEHQQRALAITREAMGAEHPQVAVILMTLGSTRSARGDLAGARAYYEEALAMQERVLDPDHPNVAFTLHALATLELDEGHPRRARALAERALEIGGEAGRVEPGLLAGIRFVLARALEHEAPERARALAEQARQAYAAGHGSANELREVEAWLETHADGGG